MQSSMASQDPNHGTQFMLEGLTGLEQPSSLPEPEKRVTQITLQTFIDNVCRQVIEGHLLRSLPTMFCPESVAAYGDEDLKRIAAEAPENIMKEKDLRDLHENLGFSLRDLRR